MTIFYDDEDRMRFLSLLGTYAERAVIRCYAWALMSNHYHLVVRTSDQPLSVLMKPLNGQFAGHVNRKLGRRGYLFQDRFKSLATQDQGYLEELIRYVHLNPIRAGVCVDLDGLDTYKWSGHATLMGHARNPFQDTATVLRRFGTRTSEARTRYRSFLESGLSVDEDDFIRRLRSSGAAAMDRAEPGMWVIGDRTFVRTALEQDRQRRLRLARYAREGWSMERVCELVARRLGIDRGAIFRRGREDVRSSARKIAAYLACTELEIPQATVARHLGVGQPAVAAMLSKGQSLASQMGVELSD